MKRILALCFLIIAVCLTIGVCYNSTKNSVENADYLRIHIRANSNEAIDQTVKYEVKDAVVEYLTPMVAECETKQQMIDLIESQKQEIKSVADNVLVQKGFDYVSIVKINNEYFPTRSYQNYTFESGFYDAVIIELGKSQGNNWWCVLYPPLCFVNGSSNNSSHIVYRSRIVEIIKSFFNG